MRSKTAWLMLTASFILLPIFANFSHAQTRDQKVLNDREALGQDEVWYYDDLDTALEIAAETKKPLMVVLRCIP